MFIREYKTKNKETGAVYIKHKLVESVRTETGPRQRVVMALGTLTIPRIDWKRLAHALECRITGQQSLLDENDQELERLALRLVSNNKLIKHLVSDAPGKEPSAPKESAAKSSYVKIDLNSVQTTQTRGIGAELLCMKAWEMLGFTGILREVGFAPKETTAAMALLFGRMISPGSERHTIEWFRKRSALAEFPGAANLSGCGKDLFYEVGDMLYARKDRIEQMLFEKARVYFPHTESTIFLYDLTNTYMEGSAMGNSLAARGHCKSKRFDCPLITFSLVISNDGMPVLSQIYKGNQSEPETMEGILERLTRRLHDEQLPLCKPTIVMDRGIATHDNVTWLRENGYHYIVVKREDDCETYRRQFQESKDTFTLIRSEKSVYDETNNVYIRKEPADENTCRILCVSEGRAKKERAIDRQKEKPFVEDIEKFNASIAKGTIKKRVKIENKLRRIVKKHERISAQYDVGLEEKDGNITCITLSRKEPGAGMEEKLYGCYIIESTHTELTSEEIWRLYMTLTRVENAFRAMKESLGVRPVYHQNAERTAAHLFISVLAYHMLITIENLLARAGDTRKWMTIREVMSTLTRGTVMLRDEKKAAYHIRVTGTPEDNHQEILDKLDIQSPLKPVVQKVG